MNIENTTCTRSYKVQKLFQKVLRFAEFLMVKSNLFHSDIAEGKNEFLE